MSDVRIWTFAGYTTRDILDIDLVSTTYLASAPDDDHAVRLRVFGDEADATSGGAGGAVTSGGAGAVGTAQTAGAAGADEGGGAGGSTLHDAVVRDALQARRVDHPHVLRVRDAGVHDQRVFVVGDHVDGRTARDELTAHTVLAPAEVVAVTRQLAGALDAVHAAGVVHGGINPHSVWIAGDDGGRRAHLTGFGSARMLARHVSAQPRARVADDLLYVAPGQIRTQQSSPEADRYALACLVYHLLTGRPPFVRDTVTALFGAHLFSVVEAPSSVQPGLSAALDDVLARALAKETGARHPSAHAFVADLDRALGERTGDDGVQPVGWSVSRRDEGPTTDDIEPSPTTANGIVGSAANGMAAAAAAANASSSPEQSDQQTDAAADATPDVAHAHSSPAADATTDVTLPDSSPAAEAPGDADGADGAGSGRSPDAVADTAGSDEAADGVASSDDAASGAGDSADAPEDDAAGSDDAVGPRDTAGSGGTAAPDATAGSVDAAMPTDTAVHDTPDVPGDASVETGDGDADVPVEASSPATTAPDGRNWASKAEQMPELLDVLGELEPLQPSPLMAPTTARHHATAILLPETIGDVDDARRVFNRPGRILALVGGMLLAAALIVAALAAFGGQSDESDAAGAAAGDAADADADPRVRTSAERTVVSPEWTASVGAAPIAAVTLADGAVVSITGDEVVTADGASGAELWTADLGAAVLDVVVVDGVVVAGVEDRVTGLDLEDGGQLWQRDDLDGTLADLAEGRQVAYGAVRGDADVALLSLEPSTGATVPIGTVPGGATGAGVGDDIALTFDRSAKQDGRLLYLLTTDTLYVFDPERRVERWRAPVNSDGVFEEPELRAAPWVDSLGAIAGAAFVVDGDGSVCRYEARNGEEVWTFCQQFPAELTEDPELYARRALVIVSSTDAVVAYDFTNGLPHWSVTLAERLQGPVAGSGEEVYYARRDGTLRALDHETGLEQWRARGFGDVTAIQADPDGVTIGQSDGTLTRLVSPVAPSS